MPFYTICAAITKQKFSLVPWLMRQKKTAFQGSIINVGVPRDRNFGTPTFFANKESME